MNLSKITCWLDNINGMPELHTGYAFAPRDCDELGTEGRFLVCKYLCDDTYWGVYDRMSGYEVGKRFRRKTRKDTLKAFYDWRLSEQGDLWDRYITRQDYKDLCAAFYKKCLHVEEVAARV